MSYETILAKESQLRGYRLYIAGIQYFFTSHPDVPGAGVGEMPVQAGSVDWTRVDGAIVTDPMPRTLPQKAFPLKQPEVTSIDVALLDIDGILTDIWATAREYPATVLAQDMTAATTGAVTVITGPLVTGLNAFSATGLVYIDNETCEYSGKDIPSSSVSISQRAKFGSVAAAHTRHILTGGFLARDVYNFLPHLHFRECVLEVFDLENTSDNAVIARGFMQEPYHETGEEQFRIRISNYCYALKRQVFKRTECKGQLSRPLLFNLSSGVVANPEWGWTENLYADVLGTPEIAADESFYPSATIASYVDDMWMPSSMMYLLVGGEDGEIVGYYDWDEIATDGEFTVALRGCFGTPLGKDGGDWPKGTPIQHLCVLAGDPNYQITTGGSNNTRQYTTATKAGVNPIEAILMLLTSTGTGTNGAYDLLPAGYGLGLDVDRVDIDAFEDFKLQKCQGRDHLYIAKEPVALMELIHADVQMLYGGMVYATYDGTITIKEFRDRIPGETVTSIELEDTPEVNNVGEQFVYNTLNVELDQWPSENDTKENAYDYRKRDALGESAAPSVTSPSLRGPGFNGYKKFGGLEVVRNQLTDFLKIVGNGIPSVEETLNALYLYLAPGSFVEITHPSPPSLISTSRGFVEQLAMILDVEPLDDQSKVRILAAIRRARNTCRWAPSAEILAVTTPSTVFTIKETVFSTDDRAVPYWADGTEIYVWDATMQAYDQVTILTYASPTITLSGAGSSKVANDRRITWADWDTCRTGGATQLLRALTEVWYGFFCDANLSLGAADDAARIYL